MKTLIVLFTLIAGTTASAMPCDTGWSCKSASGKYQVEVQRCRYINDLRNAEVKINGSKVQSAELTSSYDSKSIGGSVLAFEISIQDSKNDAHFLSLEVVGNKGVVTERVVESMPSEQKVIAKESIRCEEAE